MTQEPLRVEMELPVFLPGQNRDWDQVKAKAIIASDGAIVIKMYDHEDCERLVDYAKEGILLQISLDYRMSDELIAELNQKYKKEKE